MSISTSSSADAHASRFREASVNVPHSVPANLFLNGYEDHINTPPPACSDAAAPRSSACAAQSGRMLESARDRSLSSKVLSLTPTLRICGNLISKSGDVL